MEKRECYLDNSATTRPYYEVIEGLSKILGESYGNPSSLHQKGVDSEKILKEARQAIADSLNIASNEFYFTSGGTESNNIAVLGAVNARKKRIGTIATTQIEHPSVMGVFKHLETQGIKVLYLPVDNEGLLDLDYFEKCLKNESITFASIIHVNNEVGSIAPLDEIIRLKNKYGFILHIDAVQSYCKLDFSDKMKNIDLLSISGHKIHAIKGIGGIYIKKGLKIEPVFIGGGQEGSVKPGTENVPGIWSLGKAVEVSKSKVYGSYEKVRELKNLFVDKLIDEVLEISINGPKDSKKSAPHIINVSFNKIPGEVMLHALEEKGIYVSTGSACSSRKSQLSHVLSSMGIERENIKSSVRFSLSIMNTKDDIDYCIDSIKQCISILRR